MNKFTKTAIAAVVAVASLAPTISGVEARDWRREPGRPFVHQRHHNNDALAAGIIGLAAGAIIVGALSQPEPVYRYEPRRVYRTRPATVYDYPPAPRRVYRSDVISYDSGLEPWSREWFRYCTNRYRSFNPETGTYRGYDGRNHFCGAN